MTIKYLNKKKSSWLLYKTKTSGNKLVEGEGGWLLNVCGWPLLDTICWTGSTPGLKQEFELYKECSDGKSYLLISFLFGNNSVPSRHDIRNHTLKLAFIKSQTIKDFWIHIKLFSCQKKKKCQPLFILWEWQKKECYHQMSVLKAKLNFSTLSYNKKDFFPFSAHFSCGC